jgi:hypothetical protein
LFEVRVETGGKVSKGRIGENKEKFSLAQKLIGLYIFCVMNKRELRDIKLNLMSNPKLKRI